MEKIKQNKGNKLDVLITGIAIPFVLVGCACEEILSSLSKFYNKYLAKRQTFSSENYKNLNFPISNEDIERKVYRHCNGFGREFY